MHFLKRPQRLGDDTLLFGMIKQSFCRVEVVVVTHGEFCDLEHALGLPIVEVSSYHRSEGVILQEWHLVQQSSLNFVRGVEGQNLRVQFLETGNYLQRIIF